MKFIFKLEKILDVKRKLEDQEKIKFSIAMEKLNQARIKLQYMCERRLKYENELKDILKNGSTARQIYQGEDALQIIKMNEKIIRFEVATQEQNVEKARKSLDDAVKERKIYEKLRENAFEQFKLDVEAQEKKETDELVSYRYSTSADESVSQLQ